MSTMLRKGNFYHYSRNDFAFIDPLLLTRRLLFRWLFGSYESDETIEWAMRSFHVSINLSIHIWPSQAMSISTPRHTNEYKIIRCIGFGLCSVGVWTLSVSLSDAQHTLHCHVNACKTKKLRYCLTTWASCINSGNFCQLSQQNILRSFLVVAWIFLLSFSLVYWLHTKTTTRSREKKRMHGKHSNLTDDSKDLRLRLFKQFLSATK